MQQQGGLTCLKLGKRPCFWGGDGAGQVAQGSGGGGGGGGGGSADQGKRKEKAATAVPVVPRCQVEGCDITLQGVKEYHRRHKVCEVHAKAPRVVVHGTEQRFCQQCSRCVNHHDLRHMSSSATRVLIAVFHLYAQVPRARGV
jgi:hypothetical protein